MRNMAGRRTVTVLGTDRWSMSPSDRTFLELAVQCAFQWIAGRGPCSAPASGQREPSRFTTMMPLTIRVASLGGAMAARWRHRGDNGEARLDPTDLRLRIQIGSLMAAPSGAAIASAFGGDGNLSESS